MDETLAPALELDAGAVAAAPLLGYRVVEVAGYGGLRVSQPWIEIENDPVTIDLELFSGCRPLDGLLVDGSVGPGLATSVSGALADFRDRWAISSQLHDHVSLVAGEALVVDGGDAEVLVWGEGMLVGAHEPLATTLRLLMANFCEAARQKYVYARPQLLKSALSLLPDDVKSRYVPEASDFMEQALREMHELVVRKQRRLKELAPNFKIKPSPDAG
jgi:hypothetical protein